MTDPESSAPDPATTPVAVSAPLPGDAPFPRPIVTESEMTRLASRLWWITGLCLVIAIGLVVISQRRPGPRITIHFNDGHGLKVGEAVKYRGIDVGEVEAVMLRSNPSGVSVAVMLQPQAAFLARQGTEFWIERPQFRLSRVSGLETVVGAKYVGVRPGPSDAVPTREFQGLETPPTLTEGEFTDVTVQFAEGYGLEVGDPVRYRGLVVGEVQSIELDPRQSAVSVRLRLTRDGGALARLGTLFWVERPKVSMMEVRGLETLVGGRYIAVAPGSDDAAACREFVGLDLAPVSPIPQGGMELVLHAPQRWGVDAGVPVTYRGLRVGQVTSVGLSTDATRIEARVIIESRYRPLVRRNSVFWSTSGIDVSLGLTGLQLTAETLSTIAQGGIAFATPEMPGEMVSSGQRFAYERTAAEEWLTWRPHINLVDVNLKTFGPLPEPQRAVVRWTERLLGFSRSLEATGWVLILDSNHLLAPMDLLKPSSSATGEVTLEVAGVKLTVTPDTVQEAGSLGRVPWSGALPEGVAAWPAARIRSATEPEDVLILTDSQSAPQAVSASNFAPGTDGWDFAATSRIDTAWHGGVALSTRDGALVGQVVLRRGTPRIVPLSESR